MLGVAVGCAPSYNGAFCDICSLLMFVVAASGDHIVEAYSSMGLVIVCM